MATSNSLAGLKGHNLDLVGGDNLRDEAWLVNDETSLELLDACTASLDALFHCHVLSVVLVKDRVYKVPGISVSALGHLLKGAKVVHPVELGSLLDLIIASHENVDLEGAARAKRLGHLRADKVGSSINTGLKASAEFLKLQVAHHQVAELIPVSLLTSCGENLVLVDLHDLVIIVLQGEDRTVDAGVCTHDDPVLAANAESAIHVVNQKISITNSI